jgi:YVTN family beta-propeller protein
MLWGTSSTTRRTFSAKGWACRRSLFFAEFDEPTAAFAAIRGVIERVLDDPETPSDLADYLDLAVSFPLPQHGWDLAKATGQDPTMDPEEVELLWSSLSQAPKVWDWQRENGWYGPDGKTAFVTNLYSNTVSTIDVKTRTKHPSDIPVGTGPVGVAFTPAAWWCSDMAAAGHLGSGCSPQTKSSKPPPSDEPRPSATRDPHLGVIPQETITLIGADTREEAHYLCALANSIPFRSAAMAFSQVGGKSFGTPQLIENLRLPQYDGSEPLHRRLAE